MLEPDLTFQPRQSQSKFQHVMLEVRVRTAFSKPVFIAFDPLPSADLCLIVLNLETGMTAEVAFMLGMF
jgi:hypothetical protein